MESIKGLVIGIVIGCAVGACASATFPYRFYKPELTSWDGTLLGDKAADDLPGSTCATEGACVVMLSTDFFSMQEQYINLENELNDCQK